MPSALLFLLGRLSRINGLTLRTRSGLIGCGSTFGGVFLGEPCARDAQLDIFQHPEIGLQSTDILGSWFLLHYPLIPAFAKLFQLLNRAVAAALCLVHRVIDKDMRANVVDNVPRTIDTQPQASNAELFFQQPDHRRVACDSAEDDAPQCSDAVRSIFGWSLIAVGNLINEAFADCGVEQLSLHRAKGYYFPLCVDNLLDQCEFAVRIRSIVEQDRLDKVEILVQRLTGVDRRMAKQGLCRFAG